MLTAVRLTVTAKTPVTAALIIAVLTTAVLTIVVVRPVHLLLFLPATVLKSCVS
jgi:hypothetical protein